MADPQDDEDTGPKRHFGMALGDLGVVMIAGFFVIGFIFILFSRWQMPQLGNAFAPSKPAPVQPKPETDMYLFSPRPPQQAKKP